LKTTLHDHSCWSSDRQGIFANQFSLSNTEINQLGFIGVDDDVDENKNTPFQCWTGFMPACVEENILRSSD
jgi:hypothetical protein